MNDNKKAKLFFDASRSIRSLADVFEAIANIYSAGCTVEIDEKVLPMVAPGHQIDDIMLK